MHVPKMATKLIDCLFCTSLIFVDPIQVLWMAKNGYWICRRRVSHPVFPDMLLCTTTKFTGSPMFPAKWGEVERETFHS